MLVLAAIVVPAAGASQNHRTPGLRIAVASPAVGEQRVSGTAPIRLVFSSALNPESPLPTVSPPVAGRWVIDGREMTFTPYGGYQPDARVTVVVPGGTDGVTGVNGALLHAAATISFSVESGSVLRAEQLLSELGYLPLVWRRLPPVGRGAAAYARAVFSPPRGRFSFLSWAPSALRAMWKPGAQSAILASGVMSFERHVGLPADGQLSAQVWKKLIDLGRRPIANANPAGYTYAYVTKRLPETITIWQGNRVVERSTANTGIPASPTTDGTYPVYERLQSQVMQGVSPWGTSYSDPVSWIAYFHGSQAVHYIGREFYGYPQSFGCVELPLPAAEQAWGYLQLGTLVTISG